MVFPNLPSRLNVARALLVGFMDTSLFRFDSSRSFTVNCWYRLYQVRFCAAIHRGRAPGAAVWYCFSPAKVSMVIHPYIHLNITRELIHSKVTGILQINILIIPTSSLVKIQQEQQQQ